MSKVTHKPSVNCVKCCSAICILAILIGLQRWIAIQLDDDLAAVILILCGLAVAIGTLGPRTRAQRP